MAQKLYYEPRDQAFLLSRPGFTGHPAHLDPSTDPFILLISLSLSLPLSQISDQSKNQR